MLNTSSLLVAVVEEDHNKVIKEVAVVLVD
jgi:hypothetical protein